MTESNSWQTTRDHLSLFGKLVRVENAAALGTPDVSYALTNPKTGERGSGWIELKYLDALPARETTPVRIPHLTVEQVEFSEEWVAAGGRSWFLLRAGRATLLFGPSLARRLFHGLVPTHALFLESAVADASRFPLGRIVRCLTSP